MIEPINVGQLAFLRQPVGITEDTSKDTHSSDGTHPTGVKSSTCSHG